MISVQSPCAMSRLIHQIENIPRLGLNSICKVCWIDAWPSYECLAVLAECDLALCDTHPEFGF